jgi:hypothetical protein
VRVGVEHVDGLYEPAPGWTSIHLSNPCMAPYAGATAIKMARDLRRNVVVAGMRTSALIGERVNSNRDDRTVWGCEISGVGTKQIGVAILAEEGRTLRPMVALVKAGGLFEVGKMAHS